MLGVAEGSGGASKEKKMKEAKGYKTKIKRHRDAILSIHSIDGIDGELLISGSADHSVRCKLFSISKANLGQYSTNFAQKLSTVTCLYWRSFLLKIAPLPFYPSNPFATQSSFIKSFGSIFLTIFTFFIVWNLQ